MRETIKELFQKYFFILFVGIGFPLVFTSLFTGKIITNGNNHSDNFSKKIIVEFDMGNVVLDTNQYIQWVLAYRIEDLNEYEMLKAQSVMLRTYIYKLMDEENIINANKLKLPFLSDSQQKEKWGDNYINVYNYILSAINETENMTISHNGQLILPYFHYISNGKTRDSGNKEYLKSVESPDDILAKDFVSIKNFTYEQLNSAFNGSFSSSDFEVVTRCSAGYAVAIRVGTTIYSGEKFSEILALNSSDISIDCENDSVKITTKGFGHGYGLSLYGGNSMAKAGSTYTEILSYYYKNIQIENE